MLLSKEDFREIFYTDLREKRLARPKQIIGKKKPGKVVTPSDLKPVSAPGKTPAWWKVAPALVHVDIVTGQVLLNRWPLE
jgi:hypothetical protein